MQILFLHFRIIGCYNKDTIRTKGNSKAPRMAVLGAFSTGWLLVVKPVAEKLEMHNNRKKYIKSSLCFCCNGELMKKPPHQQ